MRTGLIVYSYLSKNVHKNDFKNLYKKFFYCRFKQVKKKSQFLDQDANVVFTMNIFLKMKSRIFKFTTLQYTIFIKQKNYPFILCNMYYFHAKDIDTPLTCRILG